MNQLSIDIETLGTHVHSQLLSIGCAMFDLKTGEIGETCYVIVAIHDNQPVSATIGTMKFWIKQGFTNPESLLDLFGSDGPNESAVKIHGALSIVAKFIEEQAPETIWANGTKFDLAMLEYHFNKNKVTVPWKYNSDGCMRTLRRFAGNIDVDSTDLISHHALSDAIWQARYISAACNKLCLV